MVYAIYAPENRDRLEVAYKEELARMLKEGFTADEIKDAKSGLLQSRKVNRSQDNQLSGSLNAMLNIGRTMKFTEEFESKLNSLTAEQITTALRKHIDPAKISVFKGGDFANKLKKP
jgi:zinc protease